MVLQLTTTIRGEPVVIPLRAGRNRVGRSVQAQFRRFPGISRSHADIVVDSGRVEIHDLGSRNTTRVNGKPIRSFVLHLGDQVEIGELRFVLEDENQEGPAPEPGPRARSENRDSASLTTQKLRGQRLLDALTRLAGALGRDDPTDPACKRSLERIAGVFRFRSACLFMVNEVGLPELRCVHHGTAAAADAGYCRSIVSEVIRRREPILVQDSRDLSEPWVSARHKGVRSAVAVPMLHEGKILGAIYLDQSDPRYAFKRRHLRQLQILTNLIAAKLHQCQSNIEMHSAAQIQRHMLSARPEVPRGFDVAVRLQPCKMVGGDFYETRCLPDGRYLYALGDVSGKGVAAALIMAETLATLRALAGSVKSPLHLMTELQAQLEKRLEPVCFVTLFLGILDPETRCLDYVNAGHEPGVVLAPGCGAEWLDSTGPPVGMPVPVALEAASTQIPAGGVFGLWSDGLTEAMRAQEHSPEMFTRERLFHCLELACEAPVSEIVRRVFREVEIFTGDPSPQDDRTLLVLKEAG